MEQEPIIPDDAPPPPAPGLSPEALAAADWLRDLARTAKTVRLYRPGNPVVEEARETFAQATRQAVDLAGGWTFRITPEEIHFEDELIVNPSSRGPTRGEAAQRLIGELPFRLYRDGVREIALLPEIPRRDVDALVDALALSWTDRDRADDIVTALWQANPTHIRVEAAPPEQPLYVAAGSGSPEAPERGLGLALGLPPLAAEMRLDLQDRGGAVGLQRETGLEETPPALYLAPRRSYEALRQEAAPFREMLLAAWEAEHAGDWHDEAGALFDLVCAKDPGPETIRNLSRFLVTGIARAIDHGRWAEASRLYQELARRDPEATYSAEALRGAIVERSELELGESLDGAAPGELNEFFGLLMALGSAGVPLALAALQGAQHSRTKAAACAALAFLCAGSPRALEPALESRSAGLVSQVVSVLGQIGGPEAGAACLRVVRHPDPVVTRELARNVPAFPDPVRTDLVLELLQSTDNQTVLIAVRSARRERNPRVAEEILRRLEGDRGEECSEEMRRSLYQALGDVGDATVVPALEAQLTQGGWLARPSWRRTAAAHALARLDCPEASAALERGANHRSEAVRAACREARERKAA